MSIANDCYRRTDKDCNRLPTAKQPNTLNPVITTDAFSNEFHDYNQTYVRRNSNNEIVSSIDDFDRRDVNNQPVTTADEWQRTDKDCSVVTTLNPNQAVRSVYAPRDYIATDLNNKPKSTTCKYTLRIIPPGTPPSLDISDYEFTYESGILIAREEGYDMLLEPEVYTVTLSN